MKLPTHTVAVAAALTIALGASTLAVRAADSMKKDSMMKSDAMSDCMKKAEMEKDAMKKKKMTDDCKMSSDSMKKDSMMKK